MTWNGRGDALNLSRLDPATGTLTVANSYTYSTWGAPGTDVHSGFVDLDFRFLYGGKEGVQWDAGLGLYLMGARHYSPSLGRFMQPDPAAIEENLYAYTENSPVTQLDPSGLRLFSPLRACMCGGGSVRGLGAGSRASAPQPARPAPKPSRTKVRQEASKASSWKMFERRGIKMHPHFTHNLKERASGRLTERNAVHTYCRGRVYWDPVEMNYVRYSSKYKISVVVSDPNGGMALTVFEDKKPNPRWQHIKFRRVC